jgi:hypothetical protein
MSPTRLQCAQRLRRLARLRRDQSAFEHGIVRGRCAAKRCESRYAIVQVTFDFRDPKSVLQSAELVCAACDRIWRRTHVPDLAQHKNLQRHRLVLIVPPEKRVRIWANRGHIHREGDDATILVNATYSLLMDAYAEWRKRNGRVLEAEARRLAKRQAAAEEAEREWLAFYNAKRDEWDARDRAAKELGIA